MTVANGVRAGVVGWPIEHSRSPLIHGHWLKHYGLDGSYGKFAVDPDGVEKFLATLAELGLAGCNVTIPHKEAAYRAASILDPSAVAVGAANTLWFEERRLSAANTDTYGFMTNLDNQAPDWRQRDRPVVVLGAGGSARAVVYGLLEAGVGEIRLVNRTRGSAEAVAEFFRTASPRIKVFDWAQRSEVARAAGVIVNTTSLGMKGVGSPDIAFASVRDQAVVADLVYVPLETPFLAAARAHGHKTVDGLGMLLHQAVPGFERWFGVKPDVTEDLRQILVADIERA